MTDRVRQIYDRKPSSYDASVGRAENLMLGDFRQQFGALMRGNVLEVAVGSGLNLPYYTPAATSCTALDLSDGMLAIARDRADHLGLPVTFVQGDATHLPFADHQFDTVGISLALCTVPDPAAVLRELRRVCRPTGTIVLLEHVLSPHRPVALLERLLTPLQSRAMGCHLDRPTIDTARAVGLTIATEQSRRLGVFRLVTARP